MSKAIKMTPEVVKEIRAEFEKAIKAAKMSDGKFSFSKSFGGEHKKATIHYTKDAWNKQVRILKEFDKEVAWHGVAFRDEDESRDDYYITDILVYPQTVSATNVEMDTEKYAAWLMENGEDERFNHIHMQAHSHVNMGTSPSSVDLKHQEDILDMLDDQGFYIFMIWNKSHSKTNKIYDMKKNILFENTDISVVVDGEDELDEFIEEAKSMVENRTYAQTTKTNVVGYPSYYNQSYSRPYNPINNGYTPGSAAKKPDVPEKGKKTEKIRTKPEPKQTSLYDDYDEDYERDMAEMYGSAYRDPFYYQ